MLSTTVIMKSLKMSEWTMLGIVKKKLCEMKFFCVFTLAALCLFVDHAASHGRLLEPPNRSSMWRYGFPTEPNWSDMELFCGGMDVQYHQNGGKCGLCGDNYADPTPRANEDGGIYGKGITVHDYQQGAEVPILVQLTQEHLGYFEFGLCDLATSPESEECFKPVPLTDGSFQYHVNGIGQYVNHTMALRLPSGKTCDRCVLRWHYRTGNNQGQCDDGSTALGCGDQETFVNCADITIYG